MLRPALAVGRRVAAATSRGPSRPAVGARRALTPLRRLAHSAAPAVSLVGKLEELEALPWWQSLPLRALGTFSGRQWQKAAGTDMYAVCAKQADSAELYAPNMGGVDRSRFYARFMLTGIHCWLCHKRLRTEQKEEWDALFKEMMETLWESNLAGMVKGEGLDLIQAMKFQKDMQLSWHGTAVGLDNALASDCVRTGFSQVLQRNLYADGEGNVPEESKAASLWLSDYFAAQSAHLESIPTQLVLRGRVTFAPAPPPLS